ncbi:hypothetical protein N9N67_06270 [Bacteriovoracaceae bacterium]|nr:hypothetical protein [Bacteriovoracaceae bacterium]
MKKSLSVIAVSLFSFSVFSATYISVGNGKWDKAQNWSNQSLGGNGVPCTDENNNDIVIITNNHKINMDGDTYVCQSVTLDSPTQNGKKNTLTIKGNASLVITGGTADTNDDIVQNFGSNGAALVINDRGSYNKDAELIISHGEVVVTKSDVDNKGIIFVDQNHPHPTGFFVLDGDLNLIGSNSILENNNTECGKVLIGDDIHMDGAASILTSPNNTNSGSIVPLIVGFNDIQNTDTGLRPNIDNEWTTFSGSTNFSYTDGNNGNPANVIGVENFFHTINQCHTALPVELVLFKVQEKRKKALLNWETATEVNNKGFFIEHSENGIAWDTLDFVVPVLKDLPEATKREYSYSDENPVYNKTNYYRLRQEDHDGKFDYSPVRSLLIKVGETVIGNVSVFPTLVQTSSPVTVQGLNEEDVFDIKIISFSGQVVYIQQGLQGVYQVEIPSSVLKEVGLYAVTVFNRSTDQIASRKIVKQ